MSGLKSMKMISRSRLLAGAAIRLEAVLSAPLPNHLLQYRMASKAINLDTINPNIVKLEYAVRGPLVIRAAEIEKELEKENEEERDFRLSADRERHALSISSETFTQRNERLASQRTRTSAARSQENEEERDLRLSADRNRHALSRSSETFTQRNERLASQQTRTSAARSQGAKKPFKRVIKANIGDAHAMGQKPITFIRQVLACVAFPEVIDKYDFPSDVKQRAKDILGACGGGSVGSYTASHGIELIRRHVAEYIERRDGHSAKWEDIVLTGGASSGIKNVLQLMCKDVGGKPSGCLIPIPQYPLYSASLAEYGLVQVGYYLDEDNAWALDEAELERALKESKAECNLRAVCVINPGNPTGQVLTRQNIETIIKFAHRHNLVLMADEVYQDNIYAEGSKFFSFKKVLRELGAPYSDELELASFMSISKGYMGECGLRGGWMELVNFDKDVQANLYKCISAMLCPTTLGQSAVDLVAKVPQKGEPSYDLWIKEKTAVLDSLNQRAKMIADTFNTMQGFKCNVVQGAMYAFPRIEMPKKAIEAAKAAGQAPDVFYAFKLLEETGICIVPGTGFGQRPGTYHFRTTILPQPALLQEMLDIFKDFHQKFTQQYA